VVGAITVVGPALKETDLPAIMAFANQTAAAIETARLLTQSRQMQEAFVLTLAGAIELREQLHNRASEHADLVDRLAEHLGLDSGRRRRVRYAALLQDLGKLGLPDTILNQPNRLNPEERAIMMTHPIVGADLLGRFDSLADLSPLVRAHHERFNGDGYPDGLAGEAIPLEMRIVAVINAFFNATVELPATTEATLAGGLRSLREEGDAGLDPSVRDAFLSMCAAAEATRAPWYETLEEAIRLRRRPVELGGPRDAAHRRRLA